MQEQQCGRILVVGPQQVGKYTLVSALLQPAAPAEKESTQEQLWNLDTKYYTTNVSICRQHLSKDAHNLAETSHGIVLVFAADSEASFLAVRDWAEKLQGSVGEVRLCIANKADALSNSDAFEQKPACQRSSWLDCAMTWCAENNYEYITTSSTNSQIDRRLVWEEQAQGIHRVRQALEASYWPNLTLKQPQLKQLPVHIQNSHEPSLTALGDDADQGGSLVSSASSQSDEAEFAAFQSAEEAELDQFDRMFGELRGEHVSSSLYIFI